MPRWRQRGGTERGTEVALDRIDVNAACAVQQVRVTPVATPVAVRMRTRDLLLLILTGLLARPPVRMRALLFGSVRF